MVQKMYRSYFKLSLSFRSAKQNHLSNFGREHEEQVAHYQWFNMGCHLNIFLLLAILVDGNGAICAFFGRGDYGEHV